MGINEKIFLAIGGLLLLQILIRKVALSGSALLMRLTAGGLVICMGLGIVWFGSSKNWIGQNIQTYLGGALVGGLILFGLSRWFPQVANFVPKPKPGKCRVCSRLARDVLIVDGEVIAVVTRGFILCLGHTGQHTDNQRVQRSFHAHAETPS